MFELPNLKVPLATITHCATCGASKPVVVLTNSPWSHPEQALVSSGTHAYDYVHEFDRNHDRDCDCTRNYSHTDNPSHASELWAELWALPDPHAVLRTHDP